MSNDIHIKERSRYKYANEEEARQAQLQKIRDWQLAHKEEIKVKRKDYNKEYQKAYYQRKKAEKEELLRLRELVAKNHMGNVSPAPVIVPVAPQILPLPNISPQVPIYTPITPQQLPSVNIPLVPMENKNHVHEEYLLQRMLLELKLQEKPISI